MRKKRIIYYNDARHYYLFVFEPPMRLQDAWVPVDEVAGTAVNTFLYGVARGDGLFYPSKVGGRFGADRVGQHWLFLRISLAIDFRKPPRCSGDSAVVLVIR